ACRQEHDDAVPVAVGADRTTATGAPPHLDLLGPTVRLATGCALSLGRRRVALASPCAAVVTSGCGPASPCGVVASWCGVPSRRGVPTLVGGRLIAPRPRGAVTGDTRARGPAPAGRPPLGGHDT